jgi:hypothetical protein
MIVDDISPHQAFANFARVEVVGPATQYGAATRTECPIAQHLERERGCTPSTRQLAKQGLERAGCP